MPAAFPGNSTTKLARSDGAGGFESAIEVAASTGITGTVAHGSAVTLTDSQSRLGNRSNTAFRHWQAGSEIVLNGTATAAESGATTPDTTEVWSGVGGTINIVSDGLRHPNIDQQYRALGKGSTITAKAFDGISGESKYYFARWVKSGSNYSTTYAAKFSSLSGPFQTNALRTRGELCTISLVGGGTKSAYVCSIINDELTIDIVGGPGAGGMSDLDGATMTGNQSGESLVIDSTSSAALGSTKVFRSYNGTATSGLGLTLVTSKQGGLVNLQEWSDAGFEGAIINDAASGFGSEPDQWHLYEIEVDFSGAAGVLRQRVDHQAVDEFSNLPKTYFSESIGFKLDNCGLDTPGTSGFVQADLGLSEDWGEVIADNELKRIVIGDAPVLGDCTHIEIQRHTSWSEGSVDFVVNQGSFDSLAGKYVFAVDSGFTEILGVGI